MSNAQDRQISRTAALTSAAQFGPTVARAQLALQMYIAAVANEEEATRSDGRAGVPAKPKPIPDAKS